MLKVVIFLCFSCFLLIHAPLISPVFGQTDCTGFKVVKPIFFPLNGFESSAIKVSDVNNDGIPDILATLPANNSIAVQLGDGESGVSTTNYFGAGINPTDLELGDFNRDGEIDVMVINTSSNQFSLLAGDGAGNFSLYQSYAAASSPQLLETGYFDQDNYLDVAVVSSGSLKIFKGNRNLSFSLIASIPIGNLPKQIVSGDFNRDGKTDLAVSFDPIGGSEVRVYTGQGNGNFSLTQTIPNIEVLALSAADIDSNGTLDLIADDYPTGNLLTYKGNGDGTFQTPVTSNVGSFFGSETVDFNNDGKLDLVSGGGSIFFGDGSGGFSFISNAGTEGTARSVGIADFNSDNLPDIAVISSGDGGLNNGTAIIIHNRNDTVKSSPLFYLNRPYEIDSADFNNDGRNDFVAVNAFNHTAHIYMQNEQGGFVPTTPNGLLISGGANENPFAVAVADFNSDGKPDFAVPDALLGKAVVFIGNGDGTFVKNVFSLSSTGSRPTSLRIGDFNNDGKPDIITMNSGTRDYSVLVNDGAGGFNLLPGVNVNSDSVNNVVGIGDITNDGKLDLVVGRSSQGSLIYLVGNGDGTFVRMPALISGLGNISSIVLKDFNNDGFLDLAIGGTDKMLVSFGVGNGGFFNQTAYPVTGSINDLEYEDFDLDGIKDMAAAGGPTNSFTFFKGLGNGAFNQGVTVNVSFSTYSITSKDFNNDGKIDFGFSSPFGGRISIIYNDTNNLPCLSAGDSQVNEGNNGTVNASLEVRLSAPSSQSVSVNYKTVGRTAAVGSDFAPTAGTLIFPPGVTAQTINLTVNGDVLDEEDEVIAVALSNPVNAIINNEVGAVKIIDDDNTLPNLTVGNGTILEGDTGTTVVSLPVSLSGASGKKIKAQIATENITAVANQDYQPFSEKIFFNPGEVSKNIPVSIIPDYRVEPDETFNVNLTAPINVNLANNRALVTILNDDVGGIVQFSVSNISFDESSNTAQIFVSRTGGNASDVTVGYRTVDGTARSGFDYQASVGSVTFDANETAKTISVPIINDLLNEDTESFSLLLENISGGGELGGQTAVTVNIQDNDPLPGLNITNYSIAEGNSGLTTVSVTVNLSAVSGRNVNVNYATRAETAVAPDDFIAASGSLNFAAGEISKTIQLSVVGDRIFEPNETFSLILSNPNNGVIINNTATITIINDDFAASRKNDFDGDGKSDIAVFRLENGTWYLQQSSDGFSGLQFGLSSDKLTPADYDGDGKTDIAVYRSGTWYLQRSSLGFTGVAFGDVNDIPVPADYDGDGKADIAVFRPSNGTWYLLQSSLGFTGLAFGQNGDKPVPADYDGDGKTDIAVNRGGNWYIQRSQLGFMGISFGFSNDKLVPADYDGDGKADIAVFRPSNGTWYLQNSTTGFSGVTFGFGTDLPVPADYDGDGKTDIAVFRNGIWYLNRSSQGFTGIQFGNATDKPIPNVFVQ